MFNVAVQQIHQLAMHTPVVYKMMLVGPQVKMQCVLIYNIENVQIFSSGGFLLN